MDLSYCFSKSCPGLLTPLRKPNTRSPWQCFKKLPWFADTAAKTQHEESLAVFSEQCETQKQTLEEMKKIRVDIKRIHHKKSSWPKKQRPKANRPQPQILNARIMPITSAQRALGSYRKNSLLLQKLASSQKGASYNADGRAFNVRFAFQGHLDVVRSVIFTGGSSPLGPEICTSGDDGVVKRWIIPAATNAYSAHGPSPSIAHRGHTGAVLSLAALPASQNISNGAKALGDGWVFSGGQDATVRVWEKDSVDPKATLDGHTDAVWTVCVLSGFSASILGDQSFHHEGADWMLLASGALDGKILIWAVSTPPQLASSPTGSRRGAGDVSSMSNYLSSPQPGMARSRSFHHSLVHRIERSELPSPTCISPFSTSGDTFVVSFADASVLIYCTRTGKELIGMASLETHNGTPSAAVNAVAATTEGLDGTLSFDTSRSVFGDKSVTFGATCSDSRLKGMVLSGYDDGYVRCFDAKSGQCTYDLAHFSAVSALSLSPGGRELVSAGHDASLRFWSLEKRSCTQEIIGHSHMPGRGVYTVIWSQDGRWVVCGGSDGIIKVLSR